MDIFKFFAKYPIKWDKVIISPDAYTRLDFEFPLTPSDFLGFADADSRVPGAHGAVNALCNAKRAIDCQADTILSAFGYSVDSPWSLRDQLGKPLSNVIQAASVNKNQPLTFQVLESFGVINPSIVGKIRKLRNLLEHQYKKVSRARVLDAIDIARLFVQATNSNLSMFSDQFGFGSGVCASDSNYARVGLEYNISFVPATPCHFEIRYWNRTIKVAKNAKPSRVPRIKVWSSTPLYYHLVRLSFAISLNKDKRAMTPIISDLAASVGQAGTAKVIDVA